MSHLAARHHVPVQVKDVLKRRTGVRRETKAGHARVARDPRREENKTTGEVGVGEVGDGPDVTARDNEHVKRCRARLPIERHDVGVLEADRRGSLVGGNPAENTVAPRVDSRS
jgi:hypothetical protein